VSSKEQILTCSFVTLVESRGDHDTEYPCVPLGGKGGTLCRSVLSMGEPA